MNDGRSLLFAYMETKEIMLLYEGGEKNLARDKIIKNVWINKVSVSDKCICILGIQSEFVLRCLKGIFESD